MHEDGRAMEPSQPDHYREANRSFVVSETTRNERYVAGVASKMVMCERSRPMRRQGPMCSK